MQCDTEGVLCYLSESLRLQFKLWLIMCMSPYYLMVNVCKKYRTAPAVFPNSKQYRLYKLYKL